MQDIAIADQHINTFDITPFVKNNAFFTEGSSPNSTRYFCSCGHVFEQESFDKSEMRAAHNENADDDLVELYRTISSSMDDKIHCPSCGTSYSSEKGRKNLVYNGEIFISAIQMKDDEYNLSLFCTKFSPDLFDSKKVHFHEYTKHVRFEKQTKKLYFANYNENEEEFDLDEVIKICDKFFVFDTVKIVALTDMHKFINNLSNYVSDAGNINIVSELLAIIRNQANESGVEVLKKVCSIFFAIIKYSNLSTLAMVKGANFLYDIMLDCQLPRPGVLAEADATSPLSIFNFLVKNYIKKINEEIGSENKETHDFVYKSKQVIITDESGNELEGDVKIIETNKDIDGNAKMDAKVVEFAEEKTLNIGYTENKGYKEGKVKKAGGSYQVMDSIDDGSLSKFLFKKITKFGEYKQLVKYFKLVDKNELIVLIGKYPIEFLTGIVDALYYRAKVDFKELQRVLDIIIDFVTIESKKTADWGEDGKLDYKTNYVLADKFDFYYYDDCLMMMDVMSFDRKRDFDRIKTFEKLREYHDNLINLFASVKNEEKTGKIMDFMNRFRFLEEREGVNEGVSEGVKNNNMEVSDALKTTSGKYSGPLRVVLLDSAAKIINDGRDQHHSGYSYSPRVSQKTYLMAQIFDESTNRNPTDPTRFTIGLNYSERDGLEFDEMKAAFNITPPDRVKKLTIEYLISKDISFKLVKDLRVEKDEELSN